MLNDEPLAQAVAGGFVDLAECDPLGGRGGRMERNRTGDQSQLEVVLTRLQPIRLPAQAARQLSDQSTTLRVVH
jgi:hypothetical protein